MRAFDAMFEERRQWFVKINVGVRYGRHGDGNGRVVKAEFVTDREWIDFINSLPLDDKLTCMFLTGRFRGGDFADGDGFYPWSSCFNHSCTPNLVLRGMRSPVRS